MNRDQEERLPRSTADSAGLHLLYLLGRFDDSNPLEGVTMRNQANRSLFIQQAMPVVLELTADQFQRSPTLHSSAVKAGLAFTLRAWPTR